MLQRNEPYLPELWRRASAEAEKSFTLAAREVLPQLQELEPLDEQWGSMAVAAS